MECSSSNNISDNDNDSNDDDSGGEYEVARKER
jgi:U3 small nucleolar ribonucleoprotein component